MRSATDEAAHTMMAAYGDKNCPVYAFVVDREFRYVYLNSAALRVGYQGRSLSEVIGLRGRDVIPQDRDNLDILEANDVRVMETGSPAQVFEVLAGRSLMSVKWPLRDDDDAIVGVAGVMFDITVSVTTERVGSCDSQVLLADVVRSTTPGDPECSRLARGLEEHLAGQLSDMRAVNVDGRDFQVADTTVEVPHEADEVVLVRDDGRQLAVEVGVHVRYVPEPAP